MSSVISWKRFNGIQHISICLKLLPISTKEHFIHSPIRYHQVPRWPCYSASAQIQWWRPPCHFLWWGDRQWEMRVICLRLPWLMIRWPSFALSTWLASAVLFFGSRRYSLALPFSSHKSFTLSLNFTWELVQFGNRTLIRTSVFVCSPHSHKEWVMSCAQLSSR